MNLKLKVVMCSGEIYNYYFDHLSSLSIFANHFDEFLANQAELINDSIEAMYAVVNDGITEMSIVW